MIHAADLVKAERANQHSESQVNKRRLGFSLLVHSVGFSQGEWLISHASFGCSC